MVGTVGAYNQTQKVPETSVSGVATTVGTGDPVVYTCPAGKKAKVLSIKVAYIANGANTFMEVKLNGIILHHEGALSVVPLELCPNPFVLAAGQTILFHGDNAGNNGTMNYFITVVELPA